MIWHINKACSLEVSLISNLKEDFTGGLASIPILQFEQGSFRRSNQDDSACRG